MQSVICRAIAASRPLVRFVACIAGLAVLTALRASAAEAGSISGAVSNAQTSNMLEGVRIEVPRLARSVLTDNTGRYVIPNVPAARMRSSPRT
jgi:hypothetical protein